MPHFPNGVILSVLDNRGHLSGSIPPSTWPNR